MIYLHVFVCVVLPWTVKSFAFMFGTGVTDLNKPSLSFCWRRCTRLPGCICLWNGLYCVRWGVTLYSFSRLLRYEERTTMFVYSVKWRLCSEI